MSSSHPPEYPGEEPSPDWDTICDYDDTTEGDYGNERYWHCDQEGIITVRPTVNIPGELLVCPNHAEVLIDSGVYRAVLPDPQHISEIVASWFKKIGLDPLTGGFND